MAAQIIVTVVDESGNPLQNAAVTLMGGTSPQVLPTGANGECTFPNLVAGNYRLLIAREGFNTKASSVTLTDGTDVTVRIRMGVVDEASTASRGNFFRLLTGLQYLFLAALAGVFAIVLIKGLGAGNLDLSNKEAARGMITFVVSVVTVAIGLILVMSAAFMSGSKDLDRRFTFGKDIFTILVGVLGTVMGFYYGQAAAGQAGSQGGAAGQTLAISAPQLNPAAPKLGSELTLTANISGGTAPYKYTITFAPQNAIPNPPAFPADSQNGTINQKFTLGSDGNLANKPITYKIEATDAKGATGLYDKGTFTPTQ